MKKALGENEFVQRLKDVKAANPAPDSMVLTTPTTAPNKSLDEMFAGESSGTLAPTNPANLLQKAIEQEIDVELLDDSPYQPRLKYDLNALQALAASIAEVGITRPIIVRIRPNGRFEIVAGHRRKRACAIAGVRPKCFVYEMDDRTAEIYAAVDNHGSVDLSDYERARLYERTQKRGIAVTQTKLALMYGCTQGRISQILKILDLPNPILAMLDRQPDLVGYSTAVDVLDLMEKLPEQRELIVEATLRLEQGAPPTSIKDWVNRRLQRTVAEHPEITSIMSNGREAFTTRIKGKKLVIEVKQGNPLETLGLINDMLERHAAGLPL